MKISKRVREQAALACSIAACEPYDGLPLYEVVDALDIGTDASELAIAARWYVGARRVSDTYSEICAEAESLLRTGWSPK